MTRIMILSALALAGCQPHLYDQVPGQLSKSRTPAQPSAGFLGVNVYSLASRPEPHFNCGRVYTDAEVERTIIEVAEMTRPLPAVIRFMAFRPFTAGGTDWSRIDLIMRLARAHGVHLIMTFESQWGSCTGAGYRDAAWYRLGYRYPEGDGAVRFRDYVRQAVIRYREEPALYMWQLMNEAESRASKDAGPDDPMALYAFTADMTSLIRSLDWRRPISLGTIGDDRNRSGADGAYYALIHALPSVDVIEAHDYPQGDDRALWSPAARNCLELAEERGKPCIIGELGMTALTPHDREIRAAVLGRRVRELWAAGAAGILIWSYRSGDAEKDIDPDDPLYRELQRFARETGN